MQHDQNTMTIKSRVHEYSFDKGCLVPLPVPCKRIARILHINEEQAIFSVSFAADSTERTKEVEFIDEIHRFYVEKSNELEAYGTGRRPLFSKCSRTPEMLKLFEYYAVFVYEVNKVIRVRLLEHTESTGEILVLALDYGRTFKAHRDDLRSLDVKYYTAPFDHALALECRMVDEEYGSVFGLPLLRNFKAGDMVELFLLSDKEPCLAVLSSVARRGASIRREILGMNLDSLACDAFHNLMTFPTLPLPTNCYNGYAPSRWPYFGWTLVSIVSAADIRNICVRDIMTSIRLLYLNDYLNVHMQLDALKCNLRLSPVDACVGMSVIVYHADVKAYRRAVISNLNSIGTICDVELIDYCTTLYDLNVADEVFIVPDIVLKIPAHMFKLKLANNTDIVDAYNRSLLTMKCMPTNSVAIVQISKFNTITNFEIYQNDDVATLTDFNHKEKRCLWRRRCSVSALEERAMVRTESLFSLHKEFPPEPVANQQSTKTDVDEETSELMLNLTVQAKKTIDSSTGICRIQI